MLFIGLIDRFISPGFQRRREGYYTAARKNEFYFLLLEKKLFLTRENAIQV